jgi:predicted nucleic acid-binding protein
MTRVFVDSSVLFSAIMSRTGHARDLLHLALTQQVTLVVSSYVIDEIKANLAKKAPQKSAYFELVQEIVGFEVVEPDEAQVKAAAEYTAVKDAPVVAAAIHGQCHYLATYDRKHLLDVPLVAEKSGVAIVTPAFVVGVIQEAGNNSS